MTRIAVLSDIHGNLPALEAVLRDLEQVRPDRVYVNGDVVNRGPQSKECLDRVRALGWPVVFGNHEEYVLKCRYGAPGEDWASPFWLSVHRLAEDELSADDISFLEALPHFRVIALPGLPAIRLVHGSLRAVAAVPDFPVSTRAARNVLPGNVPHSDAVFNVGRTALLVASLASGNYANLRYAFDDRLHQPYRSGLVPGMVNAMKAACDAGAIGSYMSGAGPSIMALIGGDGAAEPVATAMREAFARARVNAATMARRLASGFCTARSSSAVSAPARRVESNRS